MSNIFSKIFLSVTHFSVTVYFFLRLFRYLQKFYYTNKFNFLRQQIFGRKDYVPYAKTDPKKVIFFCQKLLTPKKIHFSTPKNHAQNLFF